jgi:hypothetical protein
VWGDSSELRFMSAMEGTVTPDQFVTILMPMILDRSQIFYAAGDLKYHDASGKTHDTQFCAYLVNPTDKTLAYCKAHNELN